MINNIMPVSRTYIDLNISFKPHPATGDLPRIYDENSIRQAIKNIVLTNHSEVPFEPWYGANLVALLFEPVSPIIEHAIERRIRSAIDQQEPRARITELKLNYNESLNSYTVWMSFQALGLDKPVVIDFLLERPR